jgi:hypothetical protein
MNENFIEKDNDEAKQIAIQGSEPTKVKSKSLKNVISIKLPKV